MISYEDYYEAINNCYRTYSKRYKFAPKKAAARFVFWNSLFLFSKKPGNAKKKRRYSLACEHLNVAFFCAGGFGDYLLFANYLTYFCERFCLSDNRIKVYVLYHIDSARAIFNYPLENVEIVNVTDFDFEETDFDVSFKFCVYPELVYVNESKLRNDFDEFYKYIKVCEKYYDDNRMLFEKHPSLDGLGTARSSVKGIRRIQEADLYGYLGIEEKYHFDLRINADEAAYLEKCGLRNSKFITIHRGWDGDSQYNVKAWSLTSCGNLISEIKKMFPKYKLILIGVSRNQAPVNLEGLDFDLIGKTSLEEAKILLKHASIHIDNEGGMVHLRHALAGGPSIVMFGPTSEKVFGYSENINIKSCACDTFCEWLTEDWPNKCPRSGGNAICMDNISSTDVIDAMKGICR